MKLMSCQELHIFFKYLRELLAGPESRFSFFNGLGATSAFVLKLCITADLTYLQMYSFMMCTPACRNYTLPTLGWMLPGVTYTGVPKEMKRGGGKHGSTSLYPSTGY